MGNQKAFQNNNAMIAPLQFVRALQHDSIPCAISGCQGPVGFCEVSHPTDRVKVFQFECEQCGWKETIAGQEELEPPWDEASLTAIIDEHLLHLQPICPYDDSPVMFRSLPNPRRKARYRISCFYCGRQVEMDWPPQQSKW